MSTMEITTPKTVQFSLQAAKNDAYGIVLAGGNGKRLQDFISQHFNCDYPKQYMAFTGKDSMVQQTIHRVEKLIPREKILVVVDPKHRQFVNDQLSNHPVKSLIFQPINRETAPGILLPLTYIYKTNPESTVIIFPSDHFIQQEERFMEHVQFALNVNHDRVDQIVLLGIQPDTPEVEYGWIQPGEKIAEQNGMQVRRVVKFHEKPSQSAALDFFKKGYLWNTLVMVARCKTFWKTITETLPSLKSQFENILKVVGTHAEQNVILHEYQKMESATFSQSVLEKLSSNLSVITVNNVVWSDWGNGRRLMDSLNKIGQSPQWK